MKDPDGGDAWLTAVGGDPDPIGLVATPGMPLDQFRWTGVTYDEARAGCYDGAERLQDMDIDGVDAELLFPPQRTMSHFLGDEDHDFVLAGVEAYNNFLFEEFCAPDPTRLIGLAQIPSLGIDSAIDGLRKAKARGAKGVLISNWPSGGDGLSEDDDPFWAAAVDEGMPVTIHINIISRDARMQQRAGRGQGREPASTAPGRARRPRRRRSAASATCSRMSAGNISQIDLHRRVPALPRAARLVDRDRRRVAAALARDDGRPVLAQPLVGRAPDHRAAVVLLVAQQQRDVHHRPRRHRAARTASASTR